MYIKIYWYYIISGERFVFDQRNSGGIFIPRHTVSPPPRLYSLTNNSELSRIGDLYYISFLSPTVVFYIYFFFFPTTISRPQSTIYVDWYLFLYYIPNNNNDTDLDRPNRTSDASYDEQWRPPSPVGQRTVAGHRDGTGRRRAIRPTADPTNIMQKKKKLPSPHIWHTLFTLFFFSL